MLFLKEFGQLEPLVRSLEERYINLWQRNFKEDKMEFAQYYLPFFRHVSKIGKDIIFDKRTLFS